MKNILILLILTCNIYAHEKTRIAIFNKSEIRTQTREYIHLIKADTKTKTEIYLLEQEIAKLKKDLWTVKDKDELQKLNREIYFVNQKKHTISEIVKSKNYVVNQDFILDFIKENYKDDFDMILDKEMKEKYPYHVVNMKPVDITQKIIDAIYNKSHAIK